MTLTLYEGPNFSGRSAALQTFAWKSGDCSSGLYLNPTLPINFSGMARTVEGELYLHGLATGQTTNQTPRRNLAFLIDDLPRSQPLNSLSGGQQVRLILACNLALGPGRIAVDGLLEQLDQMARPQVAQLLRDDLQVDAEVHVCDNSDIGRGLEAHRIQTFTRSADAPDLNGALSAFCNRLGGAAVSAPTIGGAGLSFCYPRAARPVFDDADFMLRPGKTYILRAPNGSGKSTLAKLLAGVVKPTAGKILVDGKVHEPAVSKTNLLFYAFQNPMHQLFGRSVIDYLSRLSGCARQRQAFLKGEPDLTPDQVMADFGLTSFVSAELFELPSFVAKRLSIAAALISRSAWLFFDEPSVGSDRDGRAALSSLFGRLSKLGFGVIIVEHGVEFDSLPDAQLIKIGRGKIIEVTQ